MHLPFGILRLRPKGSPAGHNGLKDVENQLNTSNYPRLRFGIGQNYKTFDQVKFVLDQWDETEKTKINRASFNLYRSNCMFWLRGYK